MSELEDLICDDVARSARSATLRPLDGKSIMITGATGVIGLYLTTTLQLRSRLTGVPIEIHSVSLTPPPPFLAGLFGRDKVVHHLCDLSHCRQAEALPTTDYIIHAAGYGQPGKFMSNAATTIMLNTAATKVLLEKFAKDCAFLFISTSEVYAGAARTPYGEDDIGTTDPSHLRACYIEGKRCGEALCHAHAALGARARIARVALAYGPGTRPDDARVLGSFIRAGLNAKKIQLMDRGTAVRTYCYVADAAEMLFAILLHARQHTVYNVGGRSRVTIAELAQAVAALLDVPAVIPDSDDGAMAGAPSEVALDIDRYCREFGKPAFVDLQDGLARTIAWHRHLPDQPTSKGMC